MYVPLPSVSVNDQALALVKKPNDNPTSQSLTQAADAERRSLQVSTPRPLIKANIDNEVAYHKSVNEQDAQHPDFRNRVTLSPRSTAMTA
jgi:putative membrane protein